MQIRLPPLLDRLPRTALVLLIPIAAFAVTVGIALGTSGSNSEVSALPTLALNVSNQQSTPTAVVRTATPAAANRASCSQISGTSYLSSEERDWFLKNCGAGATSGTSGTSGATTSGSTQSSSASAAVSGPEFALGDRLIIPAIGVDTTVNGSVVGADGQMATPVGYFYALWYDFKNFPGLGGYVDKGNLVLAGHVDCARCRNGSPGAAVFYDVRNLKAGDAIQYRTSGGQTVNYVVTSSEWYLPSGDWSSILASGAADLSIVTCIGTFDSSRREYTNRLVVYAMKS